MENIRKTTTAVTLGVSLAILLTLGASPAFAAPITDSYGDVYTLSSTLLPAPGTNTYEVTFNINATGYTGPAGFLDGWSLQFTDATLVTIDSAPAGTWSVPITGPMSAGGCSGNPGNHWCSQAVTGLVLGGASADYTWVLDVTMPDGTSLGPDSHVQALYDKCADITSGCKSNNLLSAGITVPEPASLMLLGTGLLPLIGLLRRKLFA